MRRILILLILSCAFAVGADAQTRPQRDSIRMADDAAPDSIEAVTGEEEPVDEGDAEADTIPEPRTGPYARNGGTGPFTVQASGQVAPRPERGEVVWINTPAPRAADTARAGTGQRVTTGQTARRDTTSAARRDTARAGTVQRVTTGQTARRDTTSATRRDTARAGTGQRVTTGQTARRDTTSATRRDTARTGTGQRVTTGQTARRDTSAARRNDGGGTTTQAGRTGSGGSTPSTGRSRTHTVVAGETFYGIARRYGVTAAQLRALNPDVDMNALEVGDQLRLPAGARDSRAGAQPRAQEPARTGTQAQTQRGTRSHTVQAGETLFGIARRYGVTVEAIRRANEMETDQVRTGQRLVIPPAS